MPCVAAVAAALLKLRPGEADGQLFEAALRDLRETVRRAFGALCQPLRADGAVRTRTVNVFARVGVVEAAYPYKPGEVTGRQAVALLCGAEQAAPGLPKATRAARAAIAKAAATLPSFAEARDFLAEEAGLDAGRETSRKIALEAGARTQRAAAAGRPAARPRRAVRPPPGARPVPPTLVVAPDGSCFPCAKPDLTGRQGRGGGQARGRNANVVCAGRYAYAGRDGSPLFLRDPIRYHVTGAGGAALGEETWRIAEQEGVDRVRRVVFLSDGENELEAVFQEHFAALPNVARVLDAMHACQYVDTMCKDLEKNPERAAKASRRLRRRLVNAGWEGFARSFARRFGADAPDRMGEDGRKAWKYLVARKSQMDYASFRRRNIPIGSGMAEAGCKLNLGRLKGPGMHWRFDNGIRIAMLRATLRSGMVITA